MHCHQEQTNSSSSVILVAKDGVQYPPIVFDSSNHLKQFLTFTDSEESAPGTYATTKIKKYEHCQALFFRIMEL